MPYKIGDYLEINELKAAVELTENDNGQVMATVRGLLHTTTSVKVLYMASLELDNMEMHESFRLSIAPDEPCCELPEVKIFNPIRSSDENIGNYKLTPKIYSAGAVEHEFSTIFRV